MNEKIMEAMDHMDEKYVKEALGAGKKVISYKPLLRWVGISACLVLIIGLCIGFYGGQPVSTQPSGGALQSGQSTEPTEEIVLPPTRYGKTQTSASLARSFTLEEGVAVADAVAWVRIGNWLGEDYENNAIGVTYFEAEVVRCYSGDLPKKLIIKQEGSSLYTYKGYPLFTKDNQLLLFLNMDSCKYQNCYYILGGYGTVMDVVLDDQDVAYVSDRTTYIGQSLDNSNKDIENMQYMATSLGSATKDMIQGEKVRNSGYVFKLDEIEKLLGEINGG